MRGRVVRARILTVAVAGALAAGALTGLSAVTPAAASGNAFGCLAANGLSGGGPTQAAEIYNGTLRIPGFGAVGIGTSGHVNWAMNPFHSDVWQKYFLSLNWLMSLTEWRGKNSGYLPRAEVIAADFAAKNPPGAGPAPSAAWSGMYAGQRATVYACLDSLDTGYQATARRILTSTGGWLGNSTHDPGDWNQGVDYNIGLLAAGCVVGGSTGSGWQSKASQRLTSMATTTIDPQGAIGEQAPGYGTYLWQRLGVAADKLAGCTGSRPSVIDSQRSKLLTFMAWDTEPGGQLTQIGDSFAAPPPSTGDAAGTPSQWAATRGAAGTYPGAATALYTSAGYAFGRTSWNPFTPGAYYTLRFGPGMKFHGHMDHQQLTLDALGHQFLVDSGHYGYTAGAYRDYLRSPYAHNVLVEPGVTYDKYAATTLSRSSTGDPRWQSYQVTDTGWAKHARTRAVLVSLDTPFAVVLDRASRATSGRFQQLWHLPPGMTVTSVSNSRAAATSADGRTKFIVLQVGLPGHAVPSGATSVVSGSTNPYQGWVSTSSGRRVKAPVVQVGRSGTSAMILTLLLPYASGNNVNVRVTRDARSNTFLRIGIGSAAHVVELTSGGSLLRTS